MEQVVNANGPLLWALFIFAITACIVVILGVILPAFRGEGISWMKPVRANLLYVASMAAMLLLFIGMRGFDWIRSFVPQTEFWDGATFMGVLIAIIGLAASLIALIQTVVSSLANDAPDPPPDHLTTALKMIDDRRGGGDTPEERREERKHYADEQAKDRQNRLAIAQLHADAGTDKPAAE